MEHEITPSIVEAHRMEQGVIITFDTGECAVYSSLLLYSIFGRADSVSNPETLVDDKKAELATPLLTVVYRSSDR